jgi:hypothetical protein
MSYTLTLYVLASASISYPNDYSLKCIATYNSEKFMESLVKLQAGEKKITVNLF